MAIEKKIKDYMVFSGDSILNALKRIDDNKSRIVFVVEDSGVLVGSLSDGDIRRWMTQSKESDLGLSVDRVMNRKFLARPASESFGNISHHFDSRFDIIPLVDERGRFVAMARRAQSGFKIGNFIVNDDSPALIIAEIGNNHNGDITLAKALVDAAIKANADCVKFQMRDLSSLYSNKGKNGEINYDLGSQYTLELLNKFQLSNDKLFQVFDYCKSRGILPLCTPWDLASVYALDEYGLDGFKVASADFTNYEMLEVLAKIGKPLICSTGMSKESEIKGSIELLHRFGTPFSVLHCNSTYPTPYKDVNLSYLPRLKRLANTVVGYSGHERGFAIPPVAVALGARIIEKHFTLDRNLEGNDHKVSLLPNEFSEMVEQIRNVELAMGRDGERELTQGEMINRENLAKSLVIKCDLLQGQIIDRSMIEVKSPGQGLQPNRINELVGKLASHDFKAGDFFFETDIIPQSPKKARYNFSRPYGIPVRYHDYESLISGIEVDFVEFHLSYHDLNEKLTKHFVAPLSVGLAVHCPELFAGDHILDLASKNEAYLAHSLNEFRRTIDAVNELVNYFPSTIKPVLVLNAGGWSTDGFLPIKDRIGRYEILSASLATFELDKVQLAIQTMPPFPWHFGGQSYHNLFVDPEEIVTFCQGTGHRICLDVSHSMMACNYYGWDFSEFLKKVLPYAIHLHIADAVGIDGEGVQIGQGDVDFAVLRGLLNEYAPNIQFIPEVWQGHKNNGEGFWRSLEFLEKSSF